MRVPANALAPVLLAVLSAVLSAPSRADAAGIRFRFLAAPAEDSVERYDVYRASSPGGEALYIGSLPAAPSDTLAFPDSSAARGAAYGYVVRAVGPGGIESDPSDTALAALPRLSLPDTLRPEGGATVYPLPREAHPLRGSAVLGVSLADSARMRLRHDTALRALVFLPVSGAADTTAVVVRASYHGKFTDEDTVVVITRAAGAPVPLRAARAAGAPLRLVLEDGRRWTVEGLPAGGRVETYGPTGRSLAPAARAAQPRLLLARDGEGRVLGRFSLPPAP